jgi:4-diphosphocytidyl-2-C-methyl-D-erythritol kinase
MRMIRMRAKAKINLYLDTLYKRTDGYHEVMMVMQSVELADNLEILTVPEGITLDSNLPYLPNDERNLAYRAAVLLQNRYDLDRGVRIYLEKRIPVAAGLAGGSTDAAAVLLALNRAWNLNLPLSELESLGAELGSDVPFCLRGGTALATGRGEVISPLPSLPRMWAVIAVPPFSVSTGDVYRSLNLEELRKEKSCELMVEGLRTGNLDLVTTNLYNSLESVTAVKHEEIDRLKRTALEEGAAGTLMSGSGPTVFALTPTRKVARAIFQRWREQVKTVFLTTTG